MLEGLLQTHLTVCIFLGAFAKARRVWDEDVMRRIGERVFITFGFRLD